jgi:hypothetical protein
MRCHEMPKSGRENGAEKWKENFPGLRKPQPFRVLQ